LRSLQPVDPLTELKLVAVDRLLDKGFPVVMIDLIKIELPFDFSVAILNILFVCGYLSLDKFEVGGCDFLDFAILGIVGKLIEVRTYFQEIDLILDVIVELLHVVVGLLADDEQRDSMVGVDLKKGVNVGRHVLEDKHDIVSTV
jgi:hypothetical protein